MKNAPQTGYIVGLLIGLVHDGSHARADCGAYRAGHNQPRRCARGRALLHIRSAARQKGKAEQGGGRRDKHCAGHVQLRLMYV